MASRKALAELSDGACVARDEIAHMFRDRNTINVAAGLNFVSDLFRDVL
jgi:hypothetical protein